MSVSFIFLFLYFHILSCFRVLIISPLLPSKYIFFSYCYIGSLPVMSRFAATSLCLAPVIGFEGRCFEPGVIDP